MTEQELQDKLDSLEREFGRVFLADAKVVRACVSGQVGFTRRRAVRQLVRGHCTLFKIAHDIQEERGWFSSNFNIVVEGDYAHIMQLFKKLKDLRS